LNGAVFSFEEEQKMQTNVTGQEMSGTYHLDQNVISFSGDEQMDFRINALVGDSLALGMKIQNMDFALRLQRTTTE
jgi:hypothetical protein